jgi:short-subunit dehydrogenase
MVTLGAGSIVNVSSRASLAALPAHMRYCASKAAMDAMTRVLCLFLLSDAASMISCARLPVDGGYTAR